MPEAIRGHDAQLEAAFGPLERRVLDALWAHATPACVRDLQAAFPGVAYTTLMTTLDRLFRKGVLHRHKKGRAFVYHPAATKVELRSRLAGSALATLLPGESAAVRPLLSLFVNAVEARDHTLLDELERLVHERRHALDRKAPR